MLHKLDGLSEFDLRRPMTPTGTNLLGLVKHLASSIERPACAARRLMASMTASSSRRMVMVPTEQPC